MTVITKDEGNRSQEFNEERLRSFIQRKLEINDTAFADKLVRGIEGRETFSASNITKLIIQTALENVDEAEPHWNFVAAKAYLLELYKQSSKNRSYDAVNKYGDFYGLLKTLAGKGIYSPDILEKY